LRRRAEAQLGARGDDPTADPTTSTSDTARLIHELQVHQIELGLQNEELHQAQMELEASLARYADLYEFAPVGYLTLGPDGEIRQLNDTAVRLLRQDRSRLLRRRFGLSVDLDSRPALSAFLARVFATRTRQVCDLTLRPEGAEALTVELIATAVQDGLECRVAATDITARKRAEELVSVRVRLQDFAMKHSSAELMQATLDEAERLTGAQVGFFHFVEADRHALSLQAWSTRTIAQAPIALESGRPFQVDKTGVWAECLLRQCSLIHNDASALRAGGGLPNGHARISRALLVPLFREGRMVAILGVGNAAVDFTARDVEAVGCLGDMAWDLVERKRAEQERQELQSQLMHAQKMEAIGTLAGGIAHDFNNLLHGILGGLSMMELEPVADHQSDIQDMRALVERGAELSRQLLGFARRGKYDVQPLELGPVLEKTSEMFGRTRKDISIQLDVAPDLRRVLMDHSQLEQVLLNLFVNAGQAMLDGGRIGLRAANIVLSDEAAAVHRVQAGQFVQLLVSDSGVGMDAATQARIFEPFFTTRERGQGTGLGLASVYGIVHSHDGFVTVESQLGMGTTFSLFLPVTEQAPLPKKSDMRPIEHGSGTILVVDDEEPILRLCSRLLRSLGYEVLTASTGEQARELVREQGERIALVILDMIMPGMNGRQTFEALRQLAPGLKVLLASGFSGDGQAQELLALGCNGFIQKPFGRATLSATVREVLSPPHRADAPRVAAATRLQQRSG
jgi:signal transduction histidine kinase/FixJ family two-component response regulator/PAS domain-containing protein